MGGNPQSVFGPIPTWEKLKRERHGYKDENMFREKLTVLNSSVAWDIAGSRNEYKCIDVDPFSVFECPVVPDIPEESAELDELEAIAEAKADTSPTVKHEDINWD